MTDKTLLVCGFGRCGSSMVMRMLHVGGMPVYCDHHTIENSYELEETLEFGLPYFCERSKGKAVKVLDPLNTRIPEGRYKVIWLSRDITEQAKSQAKFLRTLCGVDADARLIQKGFKRDEKPTLRHLKQVSGGDILCLEFEKILASPNLTAHKLKDFIGLTSLDTDKMAGVVLPRSPECQPGLDIEIILSEQTRPAEGVR